MNQTFDVTLQEVKEIQLLSDKIDIGTAELKDYLRHEELLVKAGYNILDIRKKMYQYGYMNYEDYLEARKNPIDRQQKKAVSIYVVAGIVAFSIYAVYQITKFLIKKNK